MAESEQRVVYVNGTSSYLLQGDREETEERYFSTYDAGRCGTVLPQLLLDGWRIVSVTAVSRTAPEVFGAALVVLERAR